MDREEKEGKQAHIPTVSGLVHMLWGYKHCFFGPGLLSVLPWGGREEGTGGFYSMMLKKQMVCDKGSDLTREARTAHSLNLTMRENSL